MATRQIQPSGNPFAGGAVVFDFSPVVQYEMRQQAEQKAKQEALDKYFGELAANVTPTGMADNDRDTLLQWKSQWQQKYMKNKDAINNPSKDGGKAWGEYMAELNKMQSFIEQSKNKTAVLGKVDKLRLENPDLVRRWKPRNNELIAAHDQPLKIAVQRPDGGVDFVDNPNFKPLDFAQFETKSKPLSVNERNAIIKGYRTSEKPILLGETRKQDPNDIYQDVGEKTFGLTPESLARIGELAARDFDTNEQIEDTYTDYKPTIAEREDLTKYFKMAYGADAEILTPKDLYAAFAIKDNAAPEVTPFKEVNIERREKLEEERRKREMTLQSSLIAGRQGGDSEPAADYFRFNDGDMGNGFTVQNGIVMKDGKPVSGTYNIPVTFIQPGLDKVVSQVSNSNDLLRQDQFHRVQFNIVNGIPQSTTTALGYNLNRNTIVPKRFGEGGTVRLAPSGVQQQPPQPKQEPPKPKQEPPSTSNWRSRAKPKS